MDKLVDHLFIFEGNGAIYDFPGNYSDYRASVKQQEIEALRNEVQAITAATNNTVKEPADAARKKLSYIEKKEFEQLGSEIGLFEKEKTALEVALSSGTLKSEELVSVSNRIGALIVLIDQKTDRWLELSERL